MSDEIQLPTALSGVVTKLDGLNFGIGISKTQLYSGEVAPVV